MFPVASVGSASFGWAIISLLVVLLLIWGAQRAMRAGGFSRARPGSRLGVLEALAIDPRRRLHLVRCDQRAVLVLTGGPQDVVVGWLPGDGDNLSAAALENRQ